MPAAKSDGDSRQLCLWLPSEVVEWLKKQGSIRGTILKLIQEEMGKER